ncbi:hypothetical protein [Thermostaphylospora chromogena]|jgi:hypothetical protein|uniref:hypothetical protein n=1 Tax=Thermostaphylospora chromogena TaxID=35622 RepID=UPI0013F5F926|nr:hypothetical protein [Thermostaphylospora chromogena]
MGETGIPLVGGRLRAGFHGAGAVRPSTACAETPVPDPVAAGGVRRRGPVGGTETAG